MKKFYVLGLMFSPDFDKVVLIRKTHPDWQKGKLNGVGGKIEFGENPSAAMVREFMEETGVQTNESDWGQFLLMRFPEAEIFVFASVWSDCPKLKALIEETPSVMNLSEVFFLKTVRNIQWLIPMAKWHLQGYAWEGESFEYINSRVPEKKVENKSSIADFEESASRKVGIKGWVPFAYEVVGDGMIIDGCVPDGVYSRGTRKGKPRLGHPVIGTLRRVLVTLADLEKFEKI